jgi:hypothetical protein
MVGSLVGFRVGSSVSVVRGGLGCGIGCSLKSVVSIMEGGVGIWRDCSIGSSVGLQPWEQKPSVPKRKLQRKRLPTLIKAIIELQRRKATIMKNSFQCKEWKVNHIFLGQSEVVFRATRFSKTINQGDAGS